MARVVAGDDTILIYSIIKYGVNFQTVVNNHSDKGNIFSKLDRQNNHQNIPTRPLPFLMISQNLQW